MRSLAGPGDLACCSTFQSRFQFTVRCTVVLCVVPLLFPLILTLKVPVEVDEVVLMVKVDVPWPATDVGLKLAVAPDGRLRAENVTVPVKPLSAVTVTVSVVLFGRVTVCEDGEAEMEKPFTNKVTVAVCVRLPLVPVIVIVYVPVGVLVPVVTVIVLLPEPPLTGFGLNVGFAPDSPLVALKVTFPVKPLSAVTVAV